MKTLNNIVLPALFLLGAIAMIVAAAVYFIGHIG